MTENGARKKTPMLVGGAAVAACLVLAIVVTMRTWRDSTPPGITGNLVPTATTPSSSDLLALGKTVFGRQCSACHGTGGKGDGSAAYLLYPKPRDLVAANYRLASTWERVPTDEDLFHTISRGMPGAAMPSWSHLPERTRWALVHYIKSLAAEPLVVGSPTPDEPKQGVIQVPPEVPYTDEARAKAASLYAEGCAACHGPTGKGDGTQEQINAEGLATRPSALICS